MERMRQSTDLFNHFEAQLHTLLVGTLLQLSNTVALLVLTLMPTLFL